MANAVSTASMFESHYADRIRGWAFAVPGVGTSTGCRKGASRRSYGSESRSKPCFEELALQRVRARRAAFVTGLRAGREAPGARHGDVS